MTPRPYKRRLVNRIVGALRLAVTASPAVVKGPASTDAERSFTGGLREAIRIVERVAAEVPEDQKPLKTRRGEEWIIIHTHGRVWQKEGGWIADSRKATGFQTRDACESYWRMIIDASEWPYTRVGLRKNFRKE